jgi:hypothetical protein
VVLAVIEIMTCVDYAYTASMCVHDDDDNDRRVLQAAGGCGVTKTGLARKIATFQRAHVVINQLDQVTNYLVLNIENVRLIYGVTSSSPSFNLLALSLRNGSHLEPC